MYTQKWELPPATPSYDNYTEYQPQYQAPDFESSSTWLDDSGGYIDNWYSNSPTTEETDDIFADMWKWSKTDQGTAVIGGAIKTVGAGWAASKANESAEDRAAQSLEDQKEMAAINFANQKELAILMDKLKGPSEAELRDKRIKRHNTSINKHNNINVRTFR